MAGTLILVIFPEPNLVPWARYNSRRLRPVLRRGHTNLRLPPGEVQGGGHWPPHSPCTVLGWGAPRACPGCVVVMPLPCTPAATTSEPIPQRPHNPALHLPAFSTHPCSPNQATLSSHTSKHLSFNPLSISGPPSILHSLRPDSWGKGLHHLTSPPAFMKVPFSLHFCHFC